MIPTETWTTYQLTSQQLAGTIFWEYTRVAHRTDSIFA